MSSVDSKFRYTNGSVNNNKAVCEKSAFNTQENIVFHNVNGQHHSSITYDSIEEIANWLLERTEHRPIIGIVCGTGMGPLAEHVTDKDCFPYADIPGFPQSTVESHIGRLVFGNLNGVPVICMQGRFHYYEGYPLAKCCMPIRVMKLIGITHLIVTNAAGAANKQFKVGDIMIIKDHLNLMGFAGNGPLFGPNDERFGPRFPPTSGAYDYEIARTAKTIAKEIGMESFLREGVYTCVGGPNFETVAEVRCLQRMGADAIGMSTVSEVVTARHCGMTVFGFSLITNLCVDEYDSEETVSHDQVMEAGLEREVILQEFVKRIVTKMNEAIHCNEDLNMSTASI